MTERGRGKDGIIWTRGSFIFWNDILVPNRVGQEVQESIEKKIWN